MRLLPRLVVVVAVAMSAHASAQLMTTGAGGPAAAGGGGTVTLVGTPSQCNNISSGVACTITTTGAAHGLMALLQAATATGTFTAVKAGASDTMTQAASATVNCATVESEIWYRPSTSGALTSITATTSTGTSYFATVYETTGTNASAPLDQQSTATGTGTNALGPSITTTAASELIIASEAVSGTASAVAGPFTFDNALGGDGWAHNVASATGTFQPHWTNSGATSCGNIASFKP
jgi:hypothetical protein